MMERTLYLPLEDAGDGGTVRWPVPSDDWDENDLATGEVDHTGDDPGPERLPGPELRSLGSAEA